MTHKIRKPRYLVPKGTMDHPRHYWQPTKPLLKAGWAPERLSDDYITAYGEAQILNATLDAWRRDPAHHHPNKAGPVNRDHTLSGLFDAWTASPRFTMRRPKTRKYYKGFAAPLAEIFAEVPLGSITPDQVQNTYLAIAEATPAKALGMVKTGSRAWNWGRLSRYPGVPREEGKNPFARQDIKVAKTSANIWTAEQLAAIIETADNIPTRSGHVMKSLGTAILLMHWLGAYPVDVVDLTWQNYDPANGFSYSRQKTGVAIEVMSSPAIEERLKAVREAQRQSGAIHTHILIMESTGQPWKADALRKHFRITREAAAEKYPKIAGIRDLKCGHLRHTAITETADKEASVLSIAKLFGITPARAETIINIYNHGGKTQADNAARRRLE